jgi:hypothetical protein
MKVEKRQANFFVSVSVLDGMKKVVPKGQQSEFVEQAIKAQLSSIQFQSAVQGSFGAWGKKRPYRRADKFIRQLRKSRSFTDE